MPTHLLDWHDSPPEACRRGAVTIGNFDGAHLGHRALIEETIRRGALISGPAVALTLDPHPLTLLRPDLEVPLLTTIEQRADLLHEIGIEHVVILHTSKEFLHQTAEEFFREIVLNHLDARVLIEGMNFGFGRGRTGTIETLKQLCQAHGRALSIVEPIDLDGAPVSSSRIRQALEAGDVRMAKKLLGRPFRISGIVEEGAQRGRTLGFPTANLGKVKTAIPSEGVYAVRAWSHGIAWPGAANVGPSPTFGVDARKIEVHVIGFHGDLYGTTLQVDFVERLRGVQAFHGADELKQQLQDDIAHALTILHE